MIHAESKYSRPPDPEYESGGLTDTPDIRDPVSLDLMVVFLNRPRRQWDQTKTVGLLCFLTRMMDTTQLLLLRLLGLDRDLGEPPFS